MIPTAILIATTIFPNDYECIRHLHNELERKPEKAVEYSLSLDRSIINLYGGLAILKCEGSIYTAHVVEDIPWYDIENHNQIEAP